MTTDGWEDITQDNCFLTERIRKAMATLMKSEDAVQLSASTPAHIALTLAEHDPSPLQLYRAASYMSEGQLREVVQCLMFNNSKTALVTIRLLTIMQGLPGNWELISEFLECQSSETFLLFPTRVFSLIAALGGKKAYRLCDWSSIIQKASIDGDVEAQWALSAVSEVVWDGYAERVFHVHDWQTEQRHESTPSVWRELEWARFCRRLCINPEVLWSKRAKLRGSSKTSAVAEKDTDFENVIDMGSNDASCHYVRVCGILLRRRCIQRRPRTTCTVELDGEAISNCSVDRLVITPMIRNALKEAALHLAYGLPIMVEGPTGSGKTTIISWLARNTLYDTEKPSYEERAPGVTFVQMDTAMLDTDDNSFASLIGGVVPSKEGSGFRWRPGPVGSAIECGEWVVFENMGSRISQASSTAAIIRKLANATPGDTVEAPGRGEPLVVKRGFRCIATRTISKDDLNESWDPPGGWKVWARVKMLKPSAQDQAEVLEGRQERIHDCIPRIVDVVEGVADLGGKLHDSQFRIPTLRDAARICERLDMTKRMGGTISAEHAFLDSMDVLGAWCFNETHFKKILSMVSSSWSLPLQASQDLYMKHVPEFRQLLESTQIGRTRVSRASAKHTNKFRRLSLTGHTLRLVEKTLRCLEVGENILFTGETGSGKTAVIQELASLMGKNLSVVNLSRQSELDDLLGGFRPMDLRSAIPPLARRFESAFVVSMPKEKNLHFLDALQEAVRSYGQERRALRLMQRAYQAIPKLSREKSASLSRQWNDVATDMAKLSISSYSSDRGQRGQRSEHLKSDYSAPQEPSRKKHKLSVHPPGSGELPPSPGTPQTFQDARKSAKVAFAFAEGALIKSMRSGEWILLDELNLAPPELLERLVSLLDAGQLTLNNEEGEIVTAARGFALFGAMNPPTDIGKRALPQILRERFTELYVADMLSKDDIEFLSVQRLFQVRPLMKSEDHHPTAAEREVAADVASFYLQVCDMAKSGTLEDTLSKLVRFSLRNLTRMLDYAGGLTSVLRKGPRSIREALFEGSLMSFGTQLPEASRAKLCEVAERFILRKSEGRNHQRQSLLQLLSVPHHLQSAVRILYGFPVDINDKSTYFQADATRRFVVTPGVERSVKDVCRVLTLGAPKLPVLLQGPTAAGKTSLIKYLSELTGNKLVRVNNHEHTEMSEYFGGYIAAPDGSLQFQEGPLVRAARDGHWIMLDELNLAPPDVLESLNRLLDDNREVFIPETGEVVKASKGFRLFATQNPPGLYGGRKELSKAFKSRFIEIQVNELPDADLLLILQKTTSIPSSYAGKMVSVLRRLQMQRRSSGLFLGREGFATARDLFRWASRGPRSREELALHGFYLLAERARSLKEKSVVRSILSDVVGVAPKMLEDKYVYGFDLSTESNEAPSQCLELALGKLSTDRAGLSRSLMKHGLVLTPSLKRMIILMLHCIANREPVLLVGTTGCGKTSSCAALCGGVSQKLFSINCHRHTEASDILGGFHPVRESRRLGSLFEWRDGPLVSAMKSGSWMLIDEINMADDAVIERLNSVLEPDGALLLAEKGGVVASGSLEVVVSQPGFQILATMNPGGDFGKRELSPALRNRFTELWIPNPASMEDYLPILHKRLAVTEECQPPYVSPLSIVQNVLEVSLGDDDSAQDSISLSDQRTSPFYISMRDLTAWCEFIDVAPKVSTLEPLLAVAHGARLVLLDGLSVGSTSCSNTQLESRIWMRILSLLPKGMASVAAEARYTDKTKLSVDVMGFLDNKPCVRVDRYHILKSSDNSNQSSSRGMEGYSFEAPNTRRNTARIARAMSVGSRPILLEGPPGSGKSSLLAALACVTGHRFLRINLSEGTELSDLVGCDAPGNEPGSFVFRSGPLLEALQHGYWILLDELNLASQSVLEGLNSVLDHRKSLFVPAISTEVKAHESFRIFGAQNPAADGDGRRGLPRSFLNRFTLVQIESTSDEDIQAVVDSLFPHIPPLITSKVIACLKDLSNLINLQSDNEAQFGLRDALRWCDLISRMSSVVFPENDGFGQFVMGTSFDVSILQGLRTSTIRELGEQSFHRVFGYRYNCHGDCPSLRSPSPGVIRIGLAHIQRFSESLTWNDSIGLSFPLMPSRFRELQAMSCAINAGWPLALLPFDSLVEGSSSVQLLHQVATLYGKRIKVFDGACVKDVEDFIGGYVQDDVFGLMRLFVASADEVTLKLMQPGNISFFTLTEGSETSACAESYKMCQEMRQYTDVARKDTRNSFDLLRSFLPLCRGIVDQVAFLSSRRTGFEQLASQLRSWQKTLEKQVHMRHQENLASFRWRKSDLMQAIERGEWILVTNCDACPPALLDRLNPVFERSSNSVSEQYSFPLEPAFPPMILAEAPSHEDGSPTTLQPHPHFRMFFSVSGCNIAAGRSSLSRAFLDRALKVSIRDDTLKHDRGAMIVSQGLSLNMWSNASTIRTVATEAVRGISETTNLAETSRWLRLAAANHEYQGLEMHKHQSTGSLTGLTCFGGMPHRTENIPYTTSPEYVSDPIMSATQRDLASLLYLDAIPEERILPCIEEEFLCSEHNVSFPHKQMFREWIRRKDCDTFLKTELITSGTNAFLLASISTEDLGVRATALKEVFAQITISSNRTVYAERERAGLACAKLLDRQKQVKSASESQDYFVHAIDPLYGLDRSVVHVLSKIPTTEMNVRCHHAKLFRAEILILQRLRESWRRANDLTDEASLFLRSKFAWRLHNGGGTWEEADQYPLEVAAFDIASTTSASIEEYCDYIRHDGEWEINDENGWIDIFRGAAELCEMMAGTPDAPEEALASLVYTVTLSLQEIGRKNKSAWIGGLGDLYFRLQHVKTALDNSMKLSEHGVIPISVAGRQLQAELVQSVSRCTRPAKSLAQIDAFVDAFATLITIPYGQCSDVLPSLREANEFIRTDPGWNFANADILEHWSITSHHAGVRSMQRAILLMETAYKDQLKILSTREQALEAVRKSITQLKCTPRAQKTSPAYMRKLEWILASEPQTEFNIPANVSLLDTMSSAIALPLLVELNSVSSRVNKSEQALHMHGWCSGTFLPTLLLARKSTCISLWDFAEARGEASCAAALAMSGGQKVEHTGRVSYWFVLKFLRTALALSKDMRKFGQEMFLFNRCVEEILCELETSFEKSMNQVGNEYMKDGGEFGEDSRIIGNSFRHSNCLRSFGIAWILIGVVHLKSHYIAITGSHGIDPGQLSLSIASSSFKTTLSTIASRAAFAVSGAHRLGGDSLSESVPVQRLKLIEELYKNRFFEAATGHVERPAGQSTFISYERFVHNIDMTVTKRVVNNSYIASLNGRLCVTNREDTIKEARFLKASIATFFSELDLNGRMHHFRDISTSLALGLKQIEYGLSLCLKGSEMTEALGDDQVRRTLDCISDLMPFPRAAYKWAKSAKEALKLALDTDMSGDAVIGLVRYLLNIQANVAEAGRKEASECLSLIAVEWKKRTLADELDLHGKTSLFILRERGRKLSTQFEDVLGDAEIGEDEDYARVFNPITEQEEERLLGEGYIASNRPMPETASSADLRENSAGRRMCAEDFWSLHKECFPVNPPSLEGTLSSRKRAECILIMASHLHPLATDGAPVLEAWPSAWESLAAASVLRNFSVPYVETNAHVTSEEHVQMSGSDAPSKYNFYTDGNLEQLLEASKILQSMRAAASQFQAEMFSEIGGHPVLEEVLTTIERVARALSADKPLGKVALGLENVLRKADEWHRLFATSTTRLQKFTDDLSKLIARWRRMEIQSWPLLLQNRVTSCERQACKWVFLLYDMLIHETLQLSVDDGSSAAQVISSIEHFLLSSTAGEFKTRLEMVSSLGIHLLLLEPPENHGLIGRALQGLCVYYETFLGDVRHAVDEENRAVHKELRDFMRLTTWRSTPSYDSKERSAQENEKHLQYYRLKAAGERNRRKLHKFCMKVDVALKKPISDKIFARMKQIGYDDALDAGSPLLKNKHNAPSFAGIRKGVDYLLKFLGTNSASRPLSPPKQRHGNEGTLLSRIDSLHEKLVEFGKLSIAVDKSNCGAGASFAEEVVTVVKARLKQLLHVRGAHIQIKKRSLAELLRELRRSGISSSESLVSIGRHQWLSSPEPTKCEEYNQVTNKLFRESALRVQRLREVSDSRERSQDITNDEAVKLRALSQCLFDRSCSEREVLNSVSNDLGELSTMVRFVEKLKFDDSNPVDNPKEKGNWDVLCPIVLKMREILLDLESSRETFKHVISEAERTKSVYDGSTAQNSFLIETHATESLKLLVDIGTVLDISVNAIKDFLNGDRVKVIVRHVQEQNETNDLNPAGSSEKVKEALRLLLDFLRHQHSLAQEISHNNLAVLLLKPVTAFLRDSLTSDGLDSGASLKKEKTSFEALWASMSVVAESVIKNVLVSSQRILAWTNTDASLDRKSNLVNDQPQESASSPRRVIMKVSHEMVLALVPTLNISALLRVLEQNSRLIRRALSACLTQEQSDRVLHLQLSIGKFVEDFFYSMVVPCMRRAATFHANSLLLLRCLSSLFVGLCVDGFCRPPELESEHAETHEVETGRGGGFGEAGDGDLSNAQNVSDQIEDEEQLLGLRNDSNTADERGGEAESHTGDGVDVKADFDGDLHDANQDEGDCDDANSAGEKEMAPDSGTGDNVIDERIWADSNHRDKAIEMDTRSSKMDEENHDEDGAIPLDEPELGGEFEENVCDEIKPDDSRADSAGESPGFNPDESSREQQAVKNRDMETSEQNPHNENSRTDAEDCQDRSLHEHIQGAGDSYPKQERSSFADEGGMDVPKACSESEDENGEYGGDDDEKVNRNPDGEECGQEQRKIDCEAASKTEVENHMMVGIEYASEEVCNTEDSRDDSEADNDLQDEKMQMDSEISIEDPEENTTKVTNLEDDGAEGGTNEKEMESSSNIAESNETKRLRENIHSVKDTNSGRTLNDYPADESGAVGNHDSGLEPEDQKPFSSSCHASAEISSMERTKNGGTGQGHTGEHELLETPNLSSDHEFREGASRKEANGEEGSNARLDLNPLRTSRPQELVKMWERNLKVMQSEQSHTTGEYSDANRNENGVWEFQDASDLDENDLHTLGAATRNQHLPFREENPGELQESEGNEVASVDRGATEPRNVSAASPLSATANRLETAPPENAIPESAKEKGTDHTSISAHPAEKAAEPWIEGKAHKSGQVFGNAPEQRKDLHSVDVEKMQPTRNLSCLDQDIEMWKTELLEEQRAMDLWRTLESKVFAGASALCEQLRLVLEPTVASGLTGGYRTGKRLSMRRVIEYVASDFQKDRIWLRRAKMDKRSYDVLLAIDDSASMTESRAGPMAIESLALVMSAFSKLEIGRVAVAKFGVETEMIRGFDEPLPLSARAGCRLLQGFSFSQQQTNVVRLLDFIHSTMRSNIRFADVEHLSLALVISDGRLTDRVEIRRRLRGLKDCNVLVALIIIDQILPNQPSVHDVKRVEYDTEGKLEISPYMEDFPIAFYTTVEDVRSIPSVLGDALRQWVEAASTST